MPSILKREFAPVSDETWQEIDELAAETVKRNISARKVVDFSGPHGWELGAVNEGRLDVSNADTTEGIGWGKRKVLPMIEIRSQFSLSQWEVDNIARGSKDVEMDELEEVVAKSARFEEALVYKGFEDGDMKGLIDSSDQESVDLPKDPEEYPAAVAKAVEQMDRSGVEGPYTLVLGPSQYYALLQSSERGYPKNRVIKDIIEGEILKSPVLNGAVLASTRGGDFELTIGKDFSIGYANHTQEKVVFFITESLAFRVIEPKAIVELSC